MSEPKTAEEHLESLRRLILYLMEYWPSLEDGDGITPSPDDVPQTKTDILGMISGGARSALEAIQEGKV